MLRLVVKRQVEVGKIDELDIELAICLGCVVEPARDGRASAPGARADDDGVQREAMGVSLNQYLFDAKLQIVTDAKMMPIGTGRKKARR